MDASAKRSVRALAGQVCPAGVVWLPAQGLDHPAAAGSAELPFLFSVGRISAGETGRTRTVRELELVVAALADEPDLAAALADYARYVVAQAPSTHARLTGRALAAWLRRRARASAQGKAA